MPGTNQTARLREAGSASQRRLPLYYRIGQQFLAAGVSHVSSSTIGRDLGLDPTQVRKDLEMIGLAGKPKVGFGVADLLRGIEMFLGWDRLKEAVLVGAGSLGSALLRYERFREYGITIAAAFDTDPSKIGTPIGGKEVFLLDSLPGRVRRMGVQLGIITTPPQAAQRVVDLMPHVLKGMGYGNRIIKYFDVTPGSQITWTTWAGIVQRFHKEGGEQSVRRLFQALEKYFVGGERLEALSQADENILLRLYTGATDDLKNLLLGRYGPLPFGWPRDWVYRSVFGDGWDEKVKTERVESSPLSRLPDDDLARSRKALDDELGRPATDEEFVLGLMHPKAAVDFIRFRQTYGDTTILPTSVWFRGLGRPGDSVSIGTSGKPHVIKLVSIGEGVRGIKQVVLSVDNIMHVFPVELPEAAAARKAVRKASHAVKGEIGAPMTGTVWRIGTKDRLLKAGDRLRRGEEVMNIEVMKTENAVKSPVAGVLKEICVKVNERVEEGQLLAVVGHETESDGR